MQTNLEPVTELAEQICLPLGLSVVDARISQHGRSRSLEVTIFRRGGRVSLSDCEEVSRQLGESLDQKNPPAITGSYLLEVQSPGIDRKLTGARDFDIFAGERVEVTARSHFDALGDRFTGILAGYSETTITLSKPEPAPAQAGSSKGKKAPAKVGGAKGATPKASPPDKIEVDMSMVYQVRLCPDLAKQAELEPTGDLVLAD